MLIFVVILGCLFPLAGYCLLLAALNRRPHPVLISGSWDCAGVLFAASGFLLVGGPFVLATINQQWRDAWLYDASFRSFGSLSRSWWHVRLFLWFGYFALILGGSGWLLHRRRQVTSIYNVEPEVLNQALGQVLDHLGMDGRRIGNQFVIGPGNLHPPIPDGLPETSPLPPTPIHSQTAALAFSGGTLPKNHFDPPAAVGADHGPALALLDRVLILEVDAFPAMGHVTLSWPANAGRLRQVIETELARFLGEVFTHENQARSRLLKTAASLVLAIFLILVLLVFSLFQQRLRGGW